jgi:hypothetical protein
MWYSHDNNGTRTRVSNVYTERTFPNFYNQRTTTVC